MTGRTTEPPGGGRNGDGAYMARQRDMLFHSSPLLTYIKKSILDSANENQYLFNSLEAIHWFSTRTGLNQIRCPHSPPEYHTRTRHNICALASVTRHEPNLHIMYISIYIYYAHIYVCLLFFNFLSLCICVCSTDVNVPVQICWHVQTCLQWIS